VGQKETLTMDWIAFIFQIIGTALLTRKKISSWLFFCAGNILWIFYFINNRPMLIVAILQSIFFVGLDIYGFFTWRKEHKKDHKID
jgi:nicotinamide riboside transporter PnuC